MANMQSSPSRSSASHSDNSLSPKTKVEAGENNVDDNKSDFVGDFHDLYRAKMEKFKQYEDDYTRRLMAKYFSKKNLYGGNIFDENVKINNELIKSSRWPCTRSYADPVQAFEDHNRSGSTNVPENQLNITNGKHPPKKL